MSDRNAAVAKIVEAAWRDKAFKAQLLSDPRAALKRLNITLPASMNVKVHEEDATTLHLVIPRDPSDAKLSDAELDAVAGGGGMDSWFPGTNFC
jgi:hypothetical protein